MQYQDTETRSKHYFEEPYALMYARTGLWEPQWSTPPGPPGPEFPTITISPFGVRKPCLRFRFLARLYQHHIHRQRERKRKQGLRTPKYAVSARSSRSPFLVVSWSFIPASHPQTAREKAEAGLPHSKARRQRAQFPKPALGRLLLVHGEYVARPFRIIFPRDSGPPV